jgi:hypothetical protein
MHTCPPRLLVLLPVRVLLAFYLLVYLPTYSALAFLFPLGVLAHALCPTPCTVLFPLIALLRLGYYSRLTFSSLYCSQAGGGGRGRRGEGRSDPSINAGFSLLPPPRALVVPARALEDGRRACYVLSEQRAKETVGIGIGVNNQIT